jgi:hypothetical protein
MYRDFCAARADDDDGWRSERTLLRYRYQYIFTITIVYIILGFVAARFRLLAGHKLVVGYLRLGFQNKEQLLHAYLKGF